ncbi:MAG: ImpA family metalloprotease, partial [Candidatus Sedimenticola sp. 20ELBAFRAG]
RAYDAAGNHSGFAQKSISTLALPDTQAPSKPGNMTAQADNSAGVIKLSWDAATDNKGVTAYEIVRDGSALAQTDGTSYTDTAVEREQFYSYSVVALDAASNRSDASATASAKLDTMAVEGDLEKALATGNVAYTTSDSEVISAALEEVARLRLQGDAKNPLHKPIRLEQLENLLTGLRDGSITIDWTQKNGYSKYNPDFRAKVRDFAVAMYEHLGTLDRGTQGIFADPEYRLEKLLVLLGDRLRAEIKLPMRVGDVDDTTFTRAYFADYAVYYSRVDNPAQKSMGTFSRSDFSDVALVEKNLSYQHHAVKKYDQAAKVYAVPGQTFRVTRLDDGPAYVAVKMNTLRDNTVDPFYRGKKRNGWDRPSTVNTRRFGLRKGETVTITSPHGGPIQYFVKGNNQQDIQLKFENVGEHPAYDGPASLEKFKAALDANQYDWVEVVTPHFVLHTTRQKMLATLRDARHPTVDKLVEYIWKYNHVDLLNLAGRSGPGLSRSPEVEQFCADNGWNCLNKDAGGGVQHVNADRASCGIGCSGNPFDMDKPYSPFRWGTVHELGHNLQSGTFQIYGVTGEVMNNIFPVHVQRSYKIDSTGEYPIRQASRDKLAYRILQSAFNTADPKADARTNVWKKNFEARLPFYYQMALNNSDVPHLGDSGWDVWPLLYLRKGKVGAAAKSETTWQQRKASVGLSLYNRGEADRIGSIDFMLTGLSFITKRDQRPFFDMWGLEYSDLASRQVESYGYPAAPKRYVVRGFDAPMGGIALPVDGKSTWPTAY